MKTVGTVWKFSLPINQPSEKVCRQHVCKVQIMEVRAVYRPGSPMELVGEAGPVYGTCEEQLNLYVCRRVDNGSPILAFAADLT